MSPGETLTEIRTDAHARASAIPLAILVGALLGTVHWSGLFVGGAVAGLAQRTTLRGLGAGVLAGLGIWFVFLATLQLHGAAFPALRSTPIIVVSLAIAIGYGAVGGLVRGVV